VDVQDDLDVAPVAPCSQWRRIPRRTNVDWHNIFIPPQRSLVHVGFRRLDDDESLLFSVRREWQRRVHLHRCDMVEGGGEDAHRDGLSQGPGMVLAAVGCEVLHEEYGEAHDFEAKRAQGV
jgi:hypothetical protein